MPLLKKPITIILPEAAVEEWEEMYGPPKYTGDRSKTLADAFGGDDEEDEDEDDEDDEDPEEFPDEEPDEGV